MSWAARLGCVLAFGSAPALAQEVTTYSYDALGRLIALDISGGPADGVHVSYTLDDADNRTQRQVTDTGSLDAPPSTVAIDQTRAEDSSADAPLEPEGL